MTAQVGGAAQFLTDVVMGDAGVVMAATWLGGEHAESIALTGSEALMQGTAGIAAFLLRLARVGDEGLDAPIVDRPDQWWAIPAGLRLSSTPARFLDALA